MKPNRKQILWSLAFVVGFSSSAQAQMRCENVFAVSHKAEAAKEILKDTLSGVVEATAAKKIQAEPAPRDTKDIDALAEKTWQAGTLEAKVAHLQRVHRWMYYRFPGREPMIDRMMATLKTTVLFPDNVKKPAVIDMFGFPGDGKTDMVTTLGRYLGLKSRFVQVSVKDGQVGIGLEIFRALSDVAVDGTQPPISFLVVDEFQKFKKVADLSVDAKPVDETFQSDGESKQTIDEVQQRKAFVRLMYDIYGNASEKAAPTKKIDSYIREIESYGKNISEYRSAIGRENTEIADSKKAMLEESEPKQIKFYEDSIKANENDIKSYAKQVSSMESALRTILRSMKKDYGELLGPFRDQTPAEMLDHATSNIEAFTEFLKGVSEESGQFQRIYTYKQMVTFVLGNPENTIRQVQENNKGMTMDADQYVESIRQIDVNKVREELFDDTFGADSAGLRQRLNVDQWSVMPPLNKAEWLHFVARQTEVMESQFVGIMESAGMPNVKLSIHQSVKDLLFNEGIIPTEGARVYFERSTKLTGNFISDLATRMVEASEGAKPDQLQWSYEPTQRKFIVAGYREGKLVFDERAPVVSVSNTNKKTKIDAYDRMRLLTQKAGQIVMGMSNFRSLPSTFRVDLEANDAAATTLWSAPTKARFSSTADFINLSLGANVSQNLLRDGFVSMGDPSLQFAHEMVRRMVNDLRIREMEYHFLVDKSPEGKKTYAQNFPKPEGFSPEVLEALKEAATIVENGGKAPAEATKPLVEKADPAKSGDTKSAQAAPKEDSKAPSRDAKSAQRLAENEAYGKVLRLMITDINQTLQQNAELLRGIVDLMDKRLLAYEAGTLDKPEITSTDLQRLLEYNRQFVKRKSFLNKLGIGKRPATRTITPESVGPVAGQIQTKDQSVLALDKKLANARSWTKMWRKFFNRPAPQRPLSPL